MRTPGRWSLKHPAPDPELFPLPDLAQPALEVAAAGGHSLLLAGPAGAGKSLLARSLHALLPPTSPEEARRIAEVHGRAGVPPPAGRPLRRPAPGVSPRGLLGGGSMDRPGEVELAEGGLLLLDGLQEFRRDALSALAHRLAEGQPRLWLAATVHCRGLRRCAAGGPLVRHFHMGIVLEPPHALGWRPPEGDPAAVIAERIARAGEIQVSRFAAGAHFPRNAALPRQGLLPHCALDEQGRDLLQSGYAHLALTPAAVLEVLRMARTQADLREAPRIRPLDLAVALSLTWARPRRRDSGQSRKAGRGRRLARFDPRFTS